MFVLNSMLLFEEFLIQSIDIADQAEKDPDPRSLGYSFVILQRLFSC